MKKKVILLLSVALVIVIAAWGIVQFLFQLPPKQNLPNGEAPPEGMPGMGPGAVGEQVKEFEIEDGGNMFGNISSITDDES